MKKLKNNFYSLAILKPDFLNLNLFNELLYLLEHENLKMFAVSSIFMDINFVKIFYKWEKLLHPAELKKYLCSMEMPVWIIHGDNAIIKMIKIKKRLREKHSQDDLRTLIHCPDTHLDFVREYKLLINKNGGIMKTNNQVEVIIFKKTKKADIKYLMLKRNQQKGGFWQPITGNVKIGETFEQAAIRELKEETDISDIIRIINTGYSFDFFDDNREQHEKVFAVEVADGVKVVLSAEHTEFQWAKKNECLSKYLKYPGNIAGLKILARLLEVENG